MIPFSLVFKFCLFFTFSFQKFFFVWCAQGCMGFFAFILLGLHKDPWIFGKFLAIISSNTASAQFLLPSLIVILIKHIQVLSHIFHLFLSPWFYLIILWWYIFPFMNPLLLSLICCYWINHFSYCIVQLWCSHLFMIANLHFLLPYFCAIIIIYFTSPYVIQFTV